MSKEEVIVQEQVDERMSTKDFLIGALVGGIVGATTALLLAPKSGRELREDINEQSNLIKEKTEYIKDTAVHKGNEFVAAAKEKTDTISQIVSEQSSNIINKVKQASDEIEEDFDLEAELVDEDEVFEDDADLGDVIEQKLEEVEQKLEEAEQTFEEVKENASK